MDIIGKIRVINPEQVVNATQKKEISSYHRRSISTAYHYWLYEW
jgi:hypothetical protein